jgi:hypothetical protein
VTVVQIDRKFISINWVLRDHARIIFLHGYLMAILGTSFSSAVAKIFFVAQTNWEKKRLLGYRVLAVM